ncbi:MAG TPA: SGNH/GDSL hydrolase family protein [Microbacterium sp.]|uniref:SGNH/GDSL hydrolase family protein n=1 Tax=Microbacterium sp. TaxID=51671 RepID=UPI002B6D28DC|nr:SGNH/GDSL hydrolase family protein [Microbacterium sp.]HWI30142.1 SGNH/GDSL hydrolase family protein [Microbacterium sp.]
MKRSILVLLAASALLLSACSPVTGPSPTGSHSTESPGTESRDDTPLVAFYGDSYTRGTGVSDLSRRWSTTISEQRGWREFNPSVDGLGFVNNRDALGVDLPREIIEADPDIVLVTMGLNDAFAYDRFGDGIRDRIESDFERLTTALPHARLIVVEPFWYTAQRPESIEAIIGWVHAAADEVGADYIPGASRWIQGRAGEMAADGLHPNDAGHGLIAERMDAALRELGL